MLPNDRNSTSCGRYRSAATAIAAIAACLLLTAGPVHEALAQIALDAIERADEFALADVSFPLDTAGALVVRRCGDCAPESIMLGGTVRFLLDGTPVSFAALRGAAEDLRRQPPGARTAAVFVYVDARNGRLTRLALRQP
jgi:hypothetical protein